jgi:hypothetical protein
MTAVGRLTYSQTSVLSAGAATPRMEICGVQGLSLNGPVANICGNAKVTMITVPRFW